MTPKRSPEKSSCSFGFCPDYLDLPPPPPNLDNLYHFLERQCAKKFGQGSPPPSPSPNRPNQYSLRKVDKQFGQGPPPLNLDKIQKKSYFFSGNRPLHIRSYYITSRVSSLRSQTLARYITFCCGIEMVFLRCGPISFIRSAKVGSLSVQVKMATKVRCVFAIFATNASFLRAISNFQI